PEDGILILQEDCELGDDIRDVLKLRDTVVEFEITPNRPDCLSVIGLARETGASFEKTVNYRKPIVKESGGNIADYLAVEIIAPEKCFRYTARVVKNIKIEPSPLWMRMRLRAAGVRPINNIVDITNYVMLEYGQPMHAFDYSYIDGKKIIIREAVADETFTSLDNIDHTLIAGMLVIADEKKAVALAGVMGGANSDIKDNTATVVFESANFLGSSVRVTSRALGMRTESSGRFEKGLDPENTLPAVERACELVELLGAGDIVSGITDVYPGKKAQVILPLNVNKINAFLGVNLDAQYMRKVLRSLDFVIDSDNVIVPSYRGDVKLMNDLAEEIIRIYGYNAVESTLFKARVKPGEYTPRVKYKNRVANILCSLGLNEICTFSFVSPKWVDGNPVVIKNPLGEDTSVMRTSLLPSMLNVLEHNRNQRNERAALYETAAVYIASDDANALPDEHSETVIGMYGDGVDFYDLKGICETIIQDAGIKNHKYVAVTDNPTFHPGRCAQVVAHDGTVLGILGEIYDSPTYAAVLKFEKLLEISNFEKNYKPLPKYPVVTRDFAFVCDESLEVGKIEEIMCKTGGKLVENVTLFDVYRGNQVPDGKKSVAFNVTMRADDRTLTDEEVDKVANKILTALDKELGINLRV
ncbi:MAG: phenylalanine--tRNA ligase subunit beta, partial [Oscillospiraceae bacterium]|nr:phenylalanine--tRNA ligase subunit beta [Oscillospiraceae bacterium]